MELLEGIVNISFHNDSNLYFKLAVKFVLDMCTY